MPVRRSGPVPLRHGLVQWLPTPEELARRPSLVLTDRDRQMLYAVSTHGVLTSDLLELAYFPSGTTTRTRTGSCAYDRLRLLWLWSCLDKVELPTARALGGRRPFLYTLGRAGVPVVEARGGDGGPPVRHRRLDRLDPIFWDHDLKAAALWANLQASTRTHHVRLRRWWSERELRRRRMAVRDPDTNRRLPVLPDGMVTFDYGTDEPLCYFVEIDMGTLTLPRFRRKLRAIETYWTGGLFERHWGMARLGVLVLTHSSARLDHLWSAAREEVARYRWGAYLFAEFTVLNPREFEDYGWVGLNDKDYVLVSSRQRRVAPSRQENAKTSTGL